MKYILFCIGFFIFPTLGAQDLLFQISPISVEEGISAYNATCTIEDKYGFIWIGTSLGLNRYDGNEIVVFKTQDKLQFNYIFQLYNDADSMLWVQQANSKKSIDIVHPISLKIQTFEEYFGATVDFGAIDIMYILSLDSKIYVKLVNGDYYVYSGKKQWQKLVQTSPNIKRPVNYIYHHSSTGTWIQEADSCLHFESNGNLKEQIKLPPNTYLLAINIEHQPVVYTTHDQHIDFYVIKKGQLQPFSTPIPLSKLRTTNIRVNHSSLQPPIINKHLNLFSIFLKKDNHTFSLEKIPAQLSLTNSNRSLKIINESKLNINHSNNINRFLSIKNGVTYIINITKNHFEYIIPKTAVFLHSTRSITMDQAQNIYVQNYDEHSLFWTKKNLADSITPLKSAFRPTTSTGLSMILDQDQETLWIGTEFNEIIKYSPSSNDTTYYTFCSEDQPIKQNAIWSLHQDINGKIWIGSSKGIYWLDTLGKCVQPYLQYNTYTELSKNIIFHFHANTKGLWVATSNSGIYRIDNQKGVVAHYHNKGKGIYYIPSNNIAHIHEASPEEFWISTREVGVFQWFPETGKYQQYTEANGLSNNQVHSIYSDSIDRLWMSSNRGLMYLDKKTEQIYSFFPKDGLPHEEFNLKSHYKDSNGNLYFGGLKGVIKFNPQNFNAKPSNLNIPLNITNCTQWNETQQHSKKITTSVVENKIINIYPTTIFSTIRFKLLDYESSKNHEYAYKIEGYTNDWIYTKENFIQLNGLPAGQYTLTIKGRTAFSDWQPQVIRLQIIVHAAFYQTWWFGALLISLLGGGVFLFYKYRINRLEQQKKHLEDTVKERTTKIQTDKQTIEQQAIELKNLDNLKSKFFANISHELRTPLTLIKAPLQQLLTQMVLNHKISSHQLSYIKTAYSNSQKLNQLIDEILLLSKLDAKKLILAPQNILLFDFLKQTFNNFESTAGLYQTDFQFQTTIAADISVEIDWKKLERILYNLLSNAFKFTTTKGQIIFEAICPTPNTLKITVTDNGIGIHADDIEHVFDRYYQSKQLHETEQGGTGIGLALSQEFANLLGGGLTVSSTLGKGSKFVLQLPIQLTNNNQALNTPYIWNAQNYLAKPTNANTHKANILVVEDHEGLRTFIANLLAKFYQVHTVIDGQAALDFLEKGELAIDLILSDIMMPRLDGFQLSKKIKANPKWATIPLLILSARADQQDKLTALRIGVDDYIIKPFDAPELLVRIQNLLHNSQQRQLALADQTITSSPKEENMSWLEEVEKTSLHFIRTEQGNFNLPDLAEKLKLSERQFRRRIKTLVGLTPNQYLRELRLKVAKDYLEKKHFTTVQETAQAVGFNTANHFSKLYEERFGKRPIDYLN